MEIKTGKPMGRPSAAPPMEQPSPSPRDETADAGAPIPFAEFVAMVAALIALTALCIDSMLPALPAIGHSLGVTDENQRQYVISSYLIGFSLGQIVHGPLSDRYGRKPVLAVSLLIALVCSAWAALSESFTQLLIARAALGLSIAAGRVVTVALVRDCFAGRAMARVMSLAYVVFMTVPVLAPSFGTLVLLVASWRWIFGGIAIATLAVLGWFWLRLPETLAPDRRSPLDARQIAGAYGVFFRDRYAMGYTLAAALITGGLFGFINSIQQVVSDVFGMDHWLAVVFACVAGTMAVANYFNSRLVMRLGTRLISHSAMIAMTAIAGLHLLITVTGLESFASFVVLQALMMGCFGLAGSNFSAMSMEHMGRIAGTASSLQGFISTLAGTLIGAAIGQSFNGTTIPLYGGFFVCGLLAIAMVAWTERGRLFQPAMH